MIYLCIAFIVQLIVSLFSGDATDILPSTCTYAKNMFITRKLRVKSVAELLYPVRSPQQEANDPFLVWK